MRTPFKGLSLAATSFPQYFSGVGRVVHSAHGVFLVIIQIIDQLNVLLHKAEDQTPIAANRYRQEPGAISAKFMQLPSRRIYVFCLRGTVERGQLNSQPGHAMTNYRNPETRSTGVE